MRARSAPTACCLVLLALLASLGTTEAHRTASRTQRYGAWVRSHTPAAAAASARPPRLSADDAMNCSCTELETCQAALGEKTDPCVEDGEPAYSRALHIGAVFIILGASVLGCIIPLVSKYVPFLAVDPYALCIGKCIGTGIV
jgi:hypothetical protein